MKKQSLFFVPGIILIGVSLQLLLLFYPLFWEIFRKVWR